MEQIHHKYLHIYYIQSPGSAGDFTPSLALSLFLGYRHLAPEVASHKVQSYLPAALPLHSLPCPALLSPG